MINLVTEGNSCVIKESGTTEDENQVVWCLAFAAGRTGRSESAAAAPSAAGPCRRLRLFRASSRGFAPRTAGRSGPKAGSRGHTRRRTRRASTSSARVLAVAVPRSSSDSFKVESLLPTERESPESTWIPSGLQSAPMQTVTLSVFTSQRKRPVGAPPAGARRWEGQENRPRGPRSPASMKKAAAPRVMRRGDPVVDAQIAANLRRRAASPWAPPSSLRGAADHHFTRGRTSCLWAQRGRLADTASPDL